ncbi:hypothetical protein GRF59_14760 [Paenibacillus sp. HJL G12]|uniref:Uncharacterized protein n=1 Tax=Paenibacillus dendrobii TaxID=2691084 RepID=A0A7X3ILJ5_9BACL|nr:hypothetical protein [Paenibacillus dendrobii]MWV44880.1 hypothetical protein [Paenibacillus dendrobii]
MSIDAAKSYIQQQLEHYDNFLPQLVNERDSLEYKLSLIQNRIDIYKEKVNDLKVILSLLKEV